MVENIFIGILCVVALAGGIFGWWINNGASVDDDEGDIKESEDGRDEKN